MNNRNSLSLLLLFAFLTACVDDTQQHLQLEELERMNRSDSLMTNDSLALTDWFERHGTPTEQLRVHYILGRTYADLGESARLFASAGQHNRASAARNATIQMLLDKHRTKEAKAAIDAYLSSDYVDSLGNVDPGCEMFYYNCGQYYLQTDRYDSAEYFFRKELYDGHDVNNQIAGRKGLQLLYEKLGKADSVAKYASEGYSMSDSVYMVSESQYLQSLQAMFDNSHKQLLLEQRTSELMSTRLYMVIAILSLLLIIFIVMYIVQRRDKQRAVAAADYQSKIGVLSLDERMSRSPVVVRLHYMANSNPAQVADYADIKLIRTLINDNIPSFCDIVNPPLKRLSEQEYVVCLLTRLFFPSDSIDRLTGVSLGYTSWMKTRLYKRLTGKDGTEEDFEHLIFSIK